MIVVISFIVCFVLISYQPFRAMTDYVKISLDRYEKMVDEKDKAFRLVGICRTMTASIELLLEDIIVSNDIGGAMKRYNEKYKDKRFIFKDETIKLDVDGLT